MVGCLITLLINIGIYSASIIAASGYKDNEPTKTIIEKAGCSFANDNQLLVRDVCLSPHYESNKMPINPEGKTPIDITLFSAIVTEVNERRNSLTIKLVQFFKWYDSRIKLSNDATTDNLGRFWLPREKIKHIWHPDRDMYTENLEEWKTVHENAIYGKLAILSYPVLNDTKISKEERATKLKGKDPTSRPISVKDTKLGALKTWRAKLRCVFDFSSFPFDTNRCTFLQFGNDGSVLSLAAAENRIEWSHEIDGFKIEIGNVGQLGKNSAGFNIAIKRMIEPYLYQYYLPCIAIVAVSQISFLIPLNAIPGRVALVVTQFLTLTNIFMHQIVSKISYNYIWKLRNNAYHKSFMIIKF